MKRFARKKLISLMLVLFIIIASMPVMTLTAKAADTSEMTSDQMAQVWGFTTTQPADSVAREATGANPWNSYKNSVSTFGEVPLEIAVVGSRVPYGNSHQDQNNDDLDDVYYYDDITRNSSDPSYLTMGTSGLFESVPGITDSSESDVRPSTTIAADMNGDGIDEIVRYYIDINYNGSENKPDGDIRNFNTGVAGYEANFYLEVIDSQTGKRINGKDNGKLLTVNKANSPKFFIPDSVYYWSSYMQMTAGDFNNDGKKEIALVLPDSSGAASSNNLNIWSLNSSTLARTYTGNYNFNSSYGSDSDDIKFSAFHLTSGDCDNDGVDELLFTTTEDVITEDSPSYIHIIDFSFASGYSEKIGAAIKIGSDPMGNAGVTVGDIDNDGLNEIALGGFMVNNNNENATYAYTSKDGGTTKNIKYYHELALAYMEYNNKTNQYSGFQGFTVLRDDEKTAQTCESGNDTAYKTFSGNSRSLDSSRRYRNSDNWTLPIQAVSLTGYVNDMTNDQVFFGNYMYYYSATSGRFAVYDTDGEVDVDDDSVAYNDFQAPTSSITALIPGSYLSADAAYLPTDGKEQLLVAYVKKAQGGSRSFEMALMYEKSGTKMKLDRSVKYVANAKDGGFNDMGFYPTVCAPNMDNDAILTQYIGHDFTYTKPEVLNVIASVPYFNDIMDAYPVGVWGDPGSTYFRKSSGSSQTNTGFTDISLGWYCNFHQDISVLGIRLFSIEMETNASVNTNYEYSKTIETESSVEYETSEGQDSVVMISSPLDVYQYRYYVGTSKYKSAYPNAVKDDPNTWGIMEMALPGTPETLVFPVERFNELADTYDMEKIENNFWIHTSGEPGSYPTSTSQFKNADNVLSSKNAISATMGGSSVSSELSITETEGSAYSISLTLGAKIGAGAGGLTMGTTFESTAGYGGAKASFKNTTIGATLNGFPDPAVYNVELDTKQYGLSIRLHSYTTEFEGKDIMVLYYTVENYYGLPKLPENFRKTGATESTIDLAWEVPGVISTKLSPNNYILERYDSYYGKWITVDDSISVKSGTNTYTDSDIYAGESYKYRLTAEDSTGTITNAVTITASTQPAGQSPPVITAQPIDIASNVGGTAAFTVSAKLPNGVSATRIYYQWYQRNGSVEEWKAVNGAIEKTMTFTGITQEMNGYQYCCEVTRLGTNNIRCTVQSEYAQLAVLDHTPLKFTVDYSAADHGSMKAEQIAKNVGYEIISGSKVSETSKVKFTAEPAPGYHVSKWTMDGNVVAGNTSNTLVIDSLSNSVYVTVAFQLSTYKLSYSVVSNTKEGQGSEDWGTVSAVYNGNALPLGESTTLPGTAKITFTAVPKSGYMVESWIFGTSKVAGSTNTFTIDSLSAAGDVHVLFAKKVNYKVNVSSKIINSDTAYVDNSSFTIKENGIGLQPDSDIQKYSKVDIILNPPTSAIVDSWTITRKNEYGNTMGSTIVLGSQTSYTVEQIYANYNVVVSYNIISTKTVDFGVQGGKGTISAQLVGNTTDSGTVKSGGQVQMYEDVAFTAVPGEGVLGVSGWIINGVADTSNELTRVVKADKNTTVKAVFETLPQAKTPAYVADMNAVNTLALDGNMIASDLDGDILTVVAIKADGAPDESVAKATLGTGENVGKLMITAVNEGNTSVTVEVSDDNGYTSIITIPIKVTNNQRPAPQLTGVMNTSVGKEDGKITGLDNKITYCYKISDEADYYTVAGVTEITKLQPGSYTVYCPASTSYYESPKITVIIPANEFAGGNGEAATPYKITTSEMLDKVRNHLTGCFLLMNDLDLTAYLSDTGAGYNGGHGFKPIGTLETYGYFTGTFDGNGKVIRGLKIANLSSRSALFEYIPEGAVIKNLGIDVIITGADVSMGGLVARNYGTISGCYVTGTVTNTGDNGYIGGLVASNTGRIENCYSTAEVTGGSLNGGLVGTCDIGTIQHSYAIGKSYLVRRVNYNYLVSNSYYESSNNALEDLNGTGLGRTLETMKQQSTYVGWDFDNIWMIDEGNDYPKLRQFQSIAVLVTEVTLDKTELALAVGGTETLSATITPEGATNKNVTWSSDKEAVATVDSTGKVAAVAEGTAAITVTTKDGGKTAVCNVTVPIHVNPEPVVDIDASINPTFAIYNPGDPGDVSASITWNSAQSVTYVLYGTEHLTTPYAYTVTGSALTIKSEYIDTLGLSEGDAAEFEISFDVGASVTFTVNIDNNHALSDNADLSDLKVNGVTVSGFDPDTTTYNVKLPYGTESGSGEARVEATTADPMATKIISQASQLPGDATVTVTSEDTNTKKTYTIHFSLAAPTETIVNIAVIQGVPAPVRGAYQVTTIHETTQYTGTVEWYPANNPFGASTVYTATITLTPKTDYTLMGIGANFFSVSGASSVSNFANSGVITATFPATEAVQNNNGGTGSGGGSGSSTPSAPSPTPDYSANISLGSTMVNTLPVIVNMDTGSAAIDVSLQSNLLSDTEKSVITVPLIPDVDTYTMGIPVPYLSTPYKEGTLTVNTHVGSITVSSNMLSGLTGTEGTKVEISIGRGDKSSLPEAVKTAIGDRPLIQLSVFIDGKQISWNNPEAPVTVSIPYTPTELELANHDSIIIWYVDGSGNMACISNGHYDPATGTVSFATTHFSDYAIGYNKVNFTDVATSAWYSKAVGFIAARNITTGTGNGKYSPEAKLTRGEFLVMMMKAYDIAPDTNPKNNFTDAGSTYYTNYLSMAKRLDIAAGVGNNMFAPENEITRQEMFTMLFNSLKLIGKLPQGNAGKQLSSFEDSGQVASWANDAMTLLVETGTIGGSVGKLTPTSTTTREEMAQVLYNLLSK